MTVNVFCRGFLVINPEDAFGVVRVCSYSSNSDITPKNLIVIILVKIILFWQKNRILDNNYKIVLKLILPDSPVPILLHVYDLISSLRHSNEF